MSKLIEVYRVFREKVGEDEARILVEAIEEAKSERGDYVTRQEFQQFRKEVREEFQRLREEFKAENERLREEFRAENEKLREEFKADNKVLREEFKFELQVLKGELTGRMDRLESRLWWLVGLFIAQWITVIIALLTR